MNKIVFRHVIPSVFSNRETLSGNIWQQEVQLERERLYLIEADSGKGKSTFCSYIIGYRHDYTGHILFDGHDIRQYSASDWTDIRRCRLSCLFQELRLFPELTAMENVEIKNRLTGHKQRRDIIEWFEMLGIADKTDTLVGRMSFGQQQRVAMMRALVQPFDFLLADEPISHLDDTNAAVMGRIMMDEARRQGAGVIVTSIGKHLDLSYDNTLKL